MNDVARTVRRRRLRRLSAGSLILLAILLGITAGSMIGDVAMSPGKAISGLLGTDPESAFVVRELRLPRLGVGLLVGAALGLSGAIIQGISGNPLASPDVLGITAGAGTGAVTVIVLGGEYGGASGTLASVGIPLAAIAGSLVAVIALRLLAGGGLGVIRILLVGVGIHACLSAVTAWLLMVASIVDAGRAMVWLTGSLNDVGWGNATPVLIALAVSIPALIMLRLSLPAMHLGPDVARGLGVPLSRHRALVLLICVMLAATATAAAGPIAFIALGAPQLAMRLLGTPTPPLPGSALLGGAITVWADWLGRMISDDAALPVGVLTGGLGAPLLLYLIISTTRGAIR